MANANTRQARKDKLEIKNSRLERHGPMAVASTSNCHSPNDTLSSSHKCMNEQNLLSA